jgi:hypothetical protein
MHQQIFRGAIINNGGGCGCQFALIEQFRGRKVNIFSITETSKTSFIFQPQPSFVIFFFFWGGGIPKHSTLFVLQWISKVFAHFVCRNLFICSNDISFGPTLMCMNRKFINFQPGSKYFFTPLRKFHIKFFLIIDFSWPGSWQDVSFKNPLGDPGHPLSVSRNSRWRPRSSLV